MVPVFQILLLNRITFPTRLHTLLHFWDKYSFLISVTNYQLLNITNVFAHRAHDLVCIGDEAVSSFRVADVFVLPAGRSSIVGLGGMHLHRDPWMSNFDIGVGMYTSAICIRSSGTASTI